MISADKINTRAPYRVFQAEENSVLFTTKHGVSYSVGFAPDYSFLDEGVYQFFIINLQHQHEAEDEDVFKTIAVVIEEFFNQGQPVMLYICDTMDNRQAIRDRLFKIWFNTYITSENFTMFNDHVKIDDTVYYTSIILKRDHPKHNEIINLFHDFVQNIPDKLTSLQ